MNNERCPVEEHTRHLVGVWGKLLTGKEAVEDQTGIRQSGGLDGQGRNRAAVGGISSAQPGEGRVVVGAVGRAVFVVIAHVAIVELEKLSFSLLCLIQVWNSRERGVGQRVPELVQELVSELGTVLGVTGHVGDKL